MTTYIVTNKATGQEVYRYQNDTPVEWSGMGFATHDHTPEADPAVIEDVVVVAMTWTKLEYLRRFTQDERIAIRNAAKVAPQLDDYLELLALAEEIRNDDPDIIGALQMLEASGLIDAGRTWEILNG